MPDFGSDLVKRAVAAQAPDMMECGAAASAPETSVAAFGSHFVEGDGRPLIDWPYRGAELSVDRSDVGAFVDAVRLRLKTPVKR